MLGVGEIVADDSASHVCSFTTKARLPELFHPCSAHDREANRAAATALAAWRLLGGRDAGRIDPRADEHGVPQFLEANSPPGPRPGYSCLVDLAPEVGTYRDLIAAIVHSALSHRRARRAPGDPARSGELRHSQGIPT
ncbi:D-alanine--D-alanine ligase family protein [Streptoalloteichus hindustanus]|uniref:D-ala D-ala ligase C-terminus n=1 Tax=Streptoalloteichus hindustanus TaxID=2017 RepID=A0A1M5IBD9_STRHI|nr:hypothetical protein [Streptoalloteichus hindustanus]SHG25572.1 D-ala D-ala ligase C-terminus [Streptoalloteichus hindustanus]